MVVSHRVRAGNRTPILFENTKVLLSAESPFQPRIFNLKSAGHLNDKGSHLMIFFFILLETGPVVGRLHSDLGEGESEKQCSPFICS